MNNKITISVILSVTLLLVVVGIVASLTAAAQQQQQQQQSFGQIQELREAEFSDWMDDRGYTVRLYSFLDNGDLIVYAERTNRSITAIPPTPAEID
jgi:hypothetical protein